MTKPENMLDELIAPQLAELDPTHTVAEPTRLPLWTEATTVEEMDVIIGALVQIRDQLKARLP